jgi:hypothetical protein
MPNALVGKAHECTNECPKRKFVTIAVDLVTSGLPMRRDTTRTSPSFINAGS